MAAASAPGPPLWTEMKLSGRKIKEHFYTQVEAPEDADEDLPHFRCRCGKVRIQSLKHGYTNLKQHVMLKHPDWLLECADEMQMTPPMSPKAGAASASGKAAKTKAASMPSKTEPASANVFSPQTAANAVASGRKKRRVSAAADTKLKEKTEPSEDSPTTPPPAPAAPATRRKRAASVAATTTASTAASTTATATAAGSVVKKRTDYISWDDYFMSVAFLSAMRSKDPSTQVGACIVSEDRKIVGIGYNGFPNGCSDDTLPWARESSSGDPLDTKYPFVCHAEMNAILNKNSSDLKNCTIYVALFPCNECAKLIIQSGIKHIVFLSDKYHDDWKMVASRRLLDMAGVEYRQHHTDKSKIVIDFSAIA